MRFSTVSCHGPSLSRGGEREKADVDVSRYLSYLLKKYLHSLECVSYKDADGQTLSGT